VRQRVKGCCVQEDFAATMHQLSVAWRNMSDQEKERYRVAAKHSKTARRSSGASRSGGGRQRRATVSSVRRNVQRRALKTGLT